MNALAAILVLFQQPSADFKFGPDHKVVSVPSGLQYAEMKAGSGRPLESGQLAICHYVLHLDTGEMIDTSRTPTRRPFRFVVGTQAVIKGWDEGLLGMRRGQSRRMRIPPELGYGEAGIESVIPPNATLWFDVELLGITITSMFLQDEKVTKSSSGLQFADVMEGKGTSAQDGKLVSLHYQLFNNGGKQLESSFSAGAPLVFKLGSTAVVKGFAEGIVGMKPGGIRKLKVPAQLAYGEQGNTLVKPGETIWFIVDMVSVK
jgi:peptidylprolyl isomerase